MHIRNILLITMVIRYMITIKVTTVHAVGERCVDLMAGERVEAVGTGVIARAVCPTVGACIRTMPPRMAPKDTAGCRGGNVWGGNTTTSASSTLLATTATTTPSTIATTARVVLHILHTLYLSGKTRNLGDKL